MAAAVSVLALLGCTFDPLSDFTPPQFGAFVLDDAVAGGAGDTTPDNAGQAPAEPIIQAVVPDRGLPAGGLRLEIRGRGFEPGARVFFGRAAGLEPALQGDDTLFVTTPASDPGLVDVVVINPSGTRARLEAGFLFAAPFQIDAVEPPHGPLSGGTPVTIRGTGFLPGTRVLFGTTLAIAAQRLDDSTILALSPAGPAGAVDLLATNVAGTARLRGGFLYDTAPRLVDVQPPTGSVRGGNAVRLTGIGLVADGEVWFGPNRAPIVEGNAEATALTVTAPPGAAGAVTVRINGPLGAVRAERGYVYLPDPGGRLQLFRVWPTAGTTEGGNEVALLVCGLPAGAAVDVRFGTAAATVLARDETACGLRVRTPPHAAGPVAVTVRAADQWHRLAAAFTYVRPLVITSVAPPSGPTAGGTALVLRGAGFTRDLRVTVGALPATAVVVRGADTVTAVTPPGSPGSADVVIETANARALLPDGYRYEAGGLALYAALPDHGARAGGTLLTVIGADFPADARVRIGSRLTATTLRIDANRLLTHSPPLPEGFHDVAVLSANGTAVLRRAFRVFDPAGANAGTWGEPIEGAVNVTVLDADSREPLPNAFVILGGDDATPYQGLTDAQGQVTLSGAGLAGPVDVHGAKRAYSAQSIVGFDAENVTLTLVPDNPPTPPGGGGTGEPVEVLPPGQVSGDVTGLGKYLVLPDGECRDKQRSDSLWCRPCVDDAGCQPGADDIADDPEATGFACAEAADGRFCLPSCVLPGDCPDDYQCSLRGDGQARCVPLAGRRTVRCTVSLPSIYAAPFQPGADDLTGAGGSYLLTSRLGDVAIVCFGGLERLDDGEFEPYVMGVRRHVFALPGEEVSSQDVWLDIPLNGNFEVAFDPRRPGPTEPADSRLSAYLDLGSDGVIPFGLDLRPDADGRFRLRRVPAVLDGPIYDAHFSFFGGFYNGSDANGVPYSVTLHEGVLSLDGPRIVEGGPADAWRSATGSPDHDLYALFEAQGERVAVGAGGRIVRAIPDGPWTAQPSPTDRPLYALHGIAGGPLFAVGAAGTALRRDGILWRDLGPLTDRDLHAVFAVGPDTFFAAGDHRIVRYEAGTSQVFTLAGRFRGISGHAADDVWFVGAAGLVLHWDGSQFEHVAGAPAADLHAVRALGPGRFVAVGADGLVLWHRDAAFESESTGVSGELRALAAAPDGTLFAGGDDGLLLRHDGSRWLPLAGVPATLTLRGLALGTTAPPTGVGTHTTVLGPLLPVPRFTSPADDQVWDVRDLAWTLGPGSEPHILSLALSDSSYDVRWRLVVAGARRDVRLPDLARLAGIEPFGTPGRYSAYGVYAPGLSIDRYDARQFGFGDWTSWTFDFGPLGGY